MAQAHGLIAASDVIPMFPTLVWKLELEPAFHEAANARITAAIAAMRGGQPSLAPGQGWQSEQNLHEREEFRDLVVPIQQAHRFVARCAEAKAPVKLMVREGMGHGWPGMKDDFKVCCDWFDQYLRGMKASEQ